jgi:hypothetical protein
MVIVALLVAGCDSGPHGPPGIVSGHFRLPGRPASDLQRGGLNFSPGAHGDGNGRTTKVSADGEYTISLPPGSYSVIGALSGHSGGPAPESCAETINVVVKANSTTNVDYVCDATPVTRSKP